MATIRSRQEGVICVWTDEDLELLFYGTDPEQRLYEHVVDIPQDVWDRAIEEARKLFDWQANEDCWERLNIALKETNIIK